MSRDLARSNSFQDQRSPIRPIAFDRHGGAIRQFRLRTFLIIVRRGELYDTVRCRTAPMSARGSRFLHFIIQIEFISGANKNDLMPFSRQLSDIEQKRRFAVAGNASDHDKLAEIELENLVSSHQPAPKA
jgi:hypothetical protein